jgi:integrase
MPGPSVAIERKPGAPPADLNRRSYGSGSIVTLGNSYFGKWRGVDGRQVMRKLGPVRPPGTRDGLTHSQAEAELRRKMGEVSQTVAAHDRHTILELADLHLELRMNAGLKRSTARGYRSVVTVHLVPFFGERTVDKITLPLIEAFDRHLREKRLRTQSRRNILGLLIAMLDTARRRRWIVANPATDFDKPKKSRSDVDGELRYLTLEEVDAVLAAMPDDDLGRVQRIVILTAAMTGMRRGELLGLRWRDVDWKARKVRVVRTYVAGKQDTPKSEASRRAVPLANRLATELRALRASTPYDADDDPVFTHPYGTGRPLDGSAVYKAFKRGVDAAGVRDVRFHDLRHTFGTIMAASPNVSMRTLQGWLGHSDPATTAIYAHFAPNEREAEWIDSVFDRDRGEQVAFDSGDVDSPAEQIRGLGSDTSRRRQP